MTPYEIVYGHAPQTIQAYEVGTTKVDSMDQSLRDRDIMLTLLKSNLALAQGRMKVQVDKHMSERVFNIGDWVYLRLVPYQHLSLAYHPFHKLQPRFYGPFQVLAKVRLVAYKLQSIISCILSFMYLA